MTDADWLVCTNPQLMLGILSLATSERKLRLFACAWCRRAWDRLTDPRSRAAVEIAERYAEGQATWTELLAGRDAAEEATQAIYGTGLASWLLAGEARSCC